MSEEELEKWSSDSFLRDEFWFFMEYTEFLKEKLIYLNKLKDTSIPVISNTSEFTPAIEQNEIIEKNQLNPIISETIKLKLLNYNFENYLQNDKQLSIEKIKVIESLITKNDVPFIIALLNEIGYLEYFKKEYCKTSQKRDKLLGEILGTSERRIKGNINVLHSTSKEDRNNYTSYQHVETIKELLMG